jgi:multicomponent Na+:H+ antiporter subunit B
MKINDVILRTVTKVAVFIILTFAVHLFLVGHHNPGGGFVGGLVVASAIILLLLAFSINTIKEGFPIKFETLSVIGVLVAVTTGMGPVVFGKPFLNQTFGNINLPIFGETGLATAVIFDVGVALAVLGTAISITNTISEDTCIWKR